MIGECPQCGYDWFVPCRECDGGNSAIGFAGVGAKGLGEALFGKKVILCRRCGGSGIEPCPLVGSEGTAIVQMKIEADRHGTRLVEASSTIRHQGPCKPCGATGEITCPACKGGGVIHKRFCWNQVCPACKGRKLMACRVCKGHRAIE